MSDGFYRAFEERYYAPRNVIKDLRRQYLSIIEPLVHLYPGAQTYDAGCGRGEWLELMIEKGFNPVGVDLDQGMLAACREHDLPGEHGDAVEYIRHFGDGCLAVATAFHVVEHISFDDLRAFVAEAFRALKPGGLLIMETPNPENIVVATRNFYLDPTHRKPIPSELLAFVAEFAGFQRVKMMRLQEASDLIGKADISIAELLGGVSPDYAIVAQKSADPEVMTTFDEAFEGDYGLSLETLTGRFDRRFIEVEAKATEAEARATGAEARATEAEARATGAEARATEAEARATGAEARATGAEARATEAEARATGAEARATGAEAKAFEIEIKLGQSVADVNALINSRSWRITAPLRAINGAIKVAPKPDIHSRAILFLQHSALYIRRRPRLKRLVLRLTNRFPKLKSRMIGFVRPETVIKDDSSDLASEELEHLTPHARRIYHDLKFATEKNRAIK